MNKSRIIPNMFQTPNVHVDEAMEHLSGDEYKVLSFAVRHILGWQSNFESRMATISLTMFENGYDYTNEEGEPVHMGGTGLGRKALGGILDSLVSFGLLIKVGDPTPDGQRWKLGMSPDWDKMLTRTAEQLEADRRRVENANAAKKAKRAAGSSHEPPHITGSSDEPEVGSSDEPEVGSSDELNQSHSKPYQNHESFSPTGGRLKSVLNYNDVKDLWNKKSQVWAFPEMVYIGRANKSKGLPASIWANPHAVSAKVPRELALSRYRYHVLTSPELVAALPELIGKAKVCWCDPEACHGHVLDELLQAYQGGILPELIATAEKTARNRQPVMDSVAIHIFDIPDPSRLPDDEGSTIGGFEKRVYRQFTQQFGVYNYRLAARSVERFALWMKLNKKNLFRLPNLFEPDYIAFIQQKDGEIRTHLQADGTPATTLPMAHQPRQTAGTTSTPPAAPPGRLMDPAKLRERIGGGNGRQ